MITPRRTRLVRVADLHQFRRAIATLSLGLTPDDRRLTAADLLLQIGARLVVVPTDGAARQLRRTLETHAMGAARAAVFPALVTREQLYEDLAERIAVRPRRLSPTDREAMIRAAAADAIAAGTAPPFQLRAGLVAEIVRFYDQLRRQSQAVARFEQILSESLSSDVDLDRGAERMLRQTRFLAAVYRGYEQHLVDGGYVDEHALRGHLIATIAPDPARHAIVTVADWIADPSGLHRADFDLLARIPGLDAVDVVATAKMLGSGFHQRLHDWLPGIEEVDERALGIESPSPMPVLLAPAKSTSAPCFVSRDREEELISIARQIKTGRAALGSGVVFNRPLPYLYLAGGVFGGAGIPYQTFDGQPLAAEPFAATVDLVLDFVASQFTRASIVALLRSPHLRFDGGAPDKPDTSVDRWAIAALDRALSDARYLGELHHLRDVADSCCTDAIKKPLAAAIDAAETLLPLLHPAPAATQLSRLIEFLASHVRAAGNDRERRAQTAIIGILDALAAAHINHDNRDVTVDDLASDIRRWIEDATFAPASGDGGVQLVDAQAARYGEFDDVFIIGMIDGEWPERPRRNIFYPPALLATLGWPSEKDRRGAATAAFLDLVRSARERVLLSTFSLDDEALVERSSFVDEVARAGLVVSEMDPLPPIRIFPDEALSFEPPAIDGLDEAARGWAALRLTRTATTDARYHGQAGPQCPRALSVSSIETYLTCPFKFFAQHVLRLQEEPDDDEVMDPKRQGQFIHEVFQRFFATWQERGHHAITADNLDAARAVFGEIVEHHLTRLPDAEAALERTRLLGSPVAPGLADIVFRMEAERPVDVVERLLEYRLEGEFEFASAGGPRTIALRGVADRVDLLADGTIRLIDYKLSSAPQRSRALQLPVYAVCAEQRLQGHRDKQWTLGEAAYIAFRGPKRISPLFNARSDRDQVLRDAQDKLVSAVNDIEAGRFPPTPDDVFVCSFCSFAAACRKDYVGDV